MAYLAPSFGRGCIREVRFSFLFFSREVRFSFLPTRGSLYPLTPVVRAFVFSPVLWAGLHTRGTLFFSSHARITYPIPPAPLAAYLAPSFGRGCIREERFSFLPTRGSLFFSSHARFALPLPPRFTRGCPREVRFSFLPTRGLLTPYRQPRWRRI